VIQHTKKCAIKHSVKGHVWVNEGRNDRHVNVWKDDVGGAAAKLQVPKVAERHVREMPRISVPSLEIRWLIETKSLWV
jgi:hypothetical protein